MEILLSESAVRNGLKTDIFPKKAKLQIAPSKGCRKYGSETLEFSFFGDV